MAMLVVFSFKPFTHQAPSKYQAQYEHTGPCFHKASQKARGKCHSTNALGEDDLWAPVSVRGFVEATVAFEQSKQRSLRTMMTWLSLFLPMTDSTIAGPSLPAAAPKTD